MPEFVTPMGYLSNLVDMVTKRSETSAGSNSSVGESSYERLDHRKSGELDGSGHSSASSISSSHVTASSNSEIQSVRSSEDEFSDHSESDNVLGASSESEYEGLDDDDEVDDDNDSQEVALASKAHIKDFQKTFEDSSIDPTKERLLKVYSCAFSREILYQGKMFVTGNYICFSSRIFNVSHKICLPFRNITMIEPRRYINIFPNSIEIGMLDGRRYLFASFANRNSSLSFMRKMRRHRDSHHSENGLSRSSSTRNMDGLDNSGTESGAGEGNLSHSNSIKRNGTFESNSSSQGGGGANSSSSAPSTPALTATTGGNTTAGGPGQGPGQGQGSKKPSRRGTAESRCRSTSTTLAPPPPHTSQSASTLTVGPTDYNLAHGTHPSSSLAGNTNTNTNTGNTNTGGANSGSTPNRTQTQSASNNSVANGVTFGNSSLSPALHHGLPSSSSLHAGILNGNNNTNSDSPSPSPNPANSSSNGFSTQTPSSGAQPNGNKNSSEAMSDKRQKKWPVDNLGPEEHAKTPLPSAKENEKVLSEEIINAPPGVVVNIVFGNDTAWYKDFLVDVNKNRDLNELPPFPSLSTGSERKFEYVKPLSGPVGPKQTRCKSTEKIDQWDFDSYLEITTTTLTPDVPAGSSFSTKTRAVFAWGDNNTTVLRLGTWLEWTGKTWLKSAIEKGAVDGQTSYCKMLVSEITKTVSNSPRGGAASPHSSGAAADSVRTGKPLKQASAPASKEHKSDSDTARRATEAIAAWERICVVLGITVLVLLVLLFHYWRKSRRGASVEVMEGERDLFRLQQEFDMWQWIDDRQASRSPPTIAIKDANLREAIAASEKRLQKLKDALTSG